MTRDDVIKLLKQSVNALLEDIEVEVRVYNKNNGTTYIGLTMCKGANGFNVSPVADISEIVERIVDERMSITDGTDIIVDSYMSNAIQFQYIPNREDVLDTAFYELINYDMNKELLLKVPHKRFLDFAAVYRFRPDIDGIDGSILITYDLLKSLDVDEDEIIQAAEDDLNDDNYIISNIGMELLGLDEDDVPMFVCTRPEYSYGARVLLNTKPFRRFGCDLYLIPSSIHEIIAVPSDLCEPEYLKSIIEIVNTNDVDARDVLSNNLYFYDSNKDEISIVL